MIVLDTNVVSELMRPIPEPSVEAWIADRDGASLFLTAVSEAELRYGVAAMPVGRRQDRLSAALDAMLLHDFAGRVLPFDSAAARHTPRSPPNGAPRDGPLANPTPRSLPSRIVVPWRWPPATCPTSKAWESS